MKIYKISTTFFVIGTLVKLIQTFTNLLHGDTTIVSAVIGIIVSVAICLAVFGIIRHWLSRYQRVVIEMSRSRPAWLCILEAGSTYRIISTNGDCITLSKVAKGRPVELMVWPRQLITIVKVSVQASALKSFEGIAISQVDDNRPIIKLLIYEPTSSMLAKPIQSDELDIVIRQLTEGTNVGRVAFPDTTS